MSACSNVSGQPQAEAPRAPDFTLSTADGQEFNLNGTLSSKSAVLVFFATWCPACMQEVPYVEDYYKKNGGSVAVVGINVQESKSKVSSFIEKKGVSYPILLDRSGDVARLYGVRGIPTVVAINKEGKVLYYGHDIVEMTERAGKL